MGLVLKAAAKDEAEILIYDAIGKDFWGDGVTAKQFDTDLKAFGSVRRLNVRINSAGGDVFDGVAIFNTLARHSARKTVYVDGLAASAASVLAMAGDEIRIGAGAFMMIHNAWGLAIGNASDMRRTADLLDSVSAQIADIYARRTGNDVKAIAQWMQDETWFDPDAAVKHGFADARSDDVVKLAACADLSRFRNVPPELAAAQKAPRPRLDAIRVRLAERRG